MRSSWLQPSLSRDFALLSAAILFILCMISAWVTYATYNTHIKRVEIDLEKEAVRIESTLSTEVERANYMLTALGKQIVLGLGNDLTRLAQVLKSFDSKGNIYSLFSWIGPEQHALVSSNRGVLEKPVDISDRDYVKKSLTDPWKMTIGRPIEGRVSNQWVIPVAMGLTDYTGKFAGTLMISLDISVLTERLNQLVKREGISFAIVSKTLIPLAQVSEDKDFMNHNFPTQKLVNVNFSTNPSGLIAQGSPFWGTGTYAYYRVSEHYPYIILIGYDSKHIDSAMRNMLWSRLLQMMVMALFFVLFLWIVRARMIVPVMDMTAIVSAVAKGQSHTPLPQGGPMEIENLSAQVKRVSEYIQESKRIEDELRNKMFTLKTSKERSEIEKRSMVEFLAYMCQEMSTPLNNIAGFAQVMKEQLYGPIENRKYRQYADDIFTTSNSVIDNVKDLQLYAKAGTDYIELVEKAVDVASVVNKAIRFVEQRLEVEKLAVKITLQEPLPRLIADEFRLQQVIMNLLLYALGHAMPQATMRLEARMLTENKDKQFFALVINSMDTSLTTAKLTELADKVLFGSPQPLSSSRSFEALKEQPDLRLELARTLVSLHHGAMDIVNESESNLAVVVLFSSSRIRFVDN
jgi:signal transduction histidine kinase